jgi:hypothetical protein
MAKFQDDLGVSTGLTDADGVHLWIDDSTPPIGLGGEPSAVVAPPPEQLVINHSLLLRLRAHS